MRLLLSLLLCPAAFAATSFSCPKEENTGYFADPDQCDKFWDCDRGVAYEQFCADGLAFSERSRRSSNPCVYHWRADCAGRPLQAPNGTEPCIRQNGYFPHPDPTNCINYYQCTDNVPNLETCAPGLIYNLDTYVCDWPDSANRNECLVKESIRGFTCPGNIVINNNGLRVQHPRYNDPNDCRAFFVCLNGVTPQSVNCPLGEVFFDGLERNEPSTCTLAEYVPGCENYYQDHPLKSKFKDVDGDGRVDDNLKTFFQ